MLRFILTVGAALILIATTSFPGICNALDRLKVPRLFVVQLMFLYRFVFLLTEEALRIVRARSMRGFGKKGPDLKLFVQMIGLLFLRTLGRAERVYLAMCNRGFDGEIRTIKRLKFTLRDAAFLALYFLLFVLFRFYDVSGHLGALVFRVFL
jgi:cobalt/nickel transport system permease protein